MALTQLNSPNSQAFADPSGNEFGVDISNNGNGGQGINVDGYTRLDDLFGAVNQGTQQVWAFFRIVGNGSKTHTYLYDSANQEQAVSPNTGNPVSTLTRARVIRSARTTSNTPPGDPAWARRSESVSTSKSGIRRRRPDGADSGGRDGRSGQREQLPAQRPHLTATVGRKPAASTQSTSGAPTRFLESYSRRTECENTPAE